MYRQRQRHGFLAVYLGFLLFLGVIGTVYDLLVVLVYAREIALHDRWTYLVAILSGALGVVFVLALAGDCGRGVRNVRVMIHKSGGNSPYLSSARTFRGVCRSSR